MKFHQYKISENIKENIENLGYKKPTDIQYKCIPHILKGEDVLAIAQTGTGKTAAFAIPVLHKLDSLNFKRKTKNVQCLVMTPTHELARQTQSVFINLGKGTSVKVFSVYGGVDQDPQKQKLKKGVDVLIATPGRMFDLVSQGSLDLSEVKILILDEADHMLDLGFIKDIRDLMNLIPKKRQTLFFSATIDDKIKKIAYSLVSRAIRIQISPKNPVAKNIEHAVSLIEMDDKRFFLKALIDKNSDSKMLVFVRTKVRAERLQKALERFNIHSGVIHSGREQKEREEVMKSFSLGTLKVLIATDVNARGVDIPNVDMVVNYDLPETAETYVHRVGRTGRGDQKGQAISFCSSEEEELLKEIENKLGKPIDQVEISKGEYIHTIQSNKEDQGDWRNLMGEGNEW